MIGSLDSPRRGPRLRRLAYLALLALAGPGAGQSAPGPVAAGQAVVFSLAEEFPLQDNGASGAWSCRLDDFTNSPPRFPLLPLATRDANALWGSDFPAPPRMWSEAAGYWGIGKNGAGREQYSSRNGTRWAPGEVLLHPREGAAPGRLVVGWTAPGGMVIDVHYTVGRASAQGNGIGCRLLQRGRGGDREVAAVGNIGGGITNELRGLVAAPGDQLFFRFDCCGEAVGDISRVGIRIIGMPFRQAPTPGVQPAGGVIVAGGDIAFTAPGGGAGRCQWLRNGEPIPGATNASLHLRGLRPDEAGRYSVTTGSGTGGAARLEVVPASQPPESHPSPTPRWVFSRTLAEQEAELKTNELMLRFASSRRQLAADRHRPAYHFVSPESQLNDPNGLCSWQGRWHLFYQAYPPDEFPNPVDIPKRRQHWGHAVSDDLVRWRDLPYAIHPGRERMCFSGGTVVEERQVTAFYPGIGAGQMVAVARDPLLLNWEKIPGNPVRAPAGDSCIWKEGDTYLGLVGADCLVSSQNLVDWTVHGAFLEGNPFPLGDAGACPGFVPIGGKHLLVSFSHTAGGQYLLGDYDRPGRRFRPYARGRFNHGTVSPGGVHAPCAAADGQGGVANILNINDGKPDDHWDQIMSLAQRLSLGADASLRIEPVPAATSLRGAHQHAGPTVLPANQELVLPGIEGGAMELDLELDPRQARWVQLNVLRSAGAEEQTTITFYNFDRQLSIWYATPGVLCLDGSRSSTSPEVWLRPPERAVLERGKELLNLRVFIDRSVVEVFANRRLYLAMRVYPSRPDSTGVSLRAQGQEAILTRLDAWQMPSIWP